MRIWYVADARLPGRAANTVQIMKMCAAFGAAGAEVTLHVRLGAEGADTGLFNYYAVPRSFQIVRAPRLIPGRSARDRWNIPFTLSILPHLKLGSRKYDLIYTRLPLLALLAPRMGLRVAFEAHRLVPEDGFLSSRLSRAFPGATRQPAFAGLVGISRVLCDWYEQRGVPAAKVLVAHDGVDLERFEPALSKAEARVRLNLPVDQAIVGYCGHFYAGRGIDELLSCATRMKSVLFLLVGGNEGDVKRVGEQAAGLGLTNVRLTGFQPNAELPRYLFAADVLAMPYNAQTGSAVFMSPMKMFEYMAAGRPIVATNFPSVREVLRDGENAILVEPGSADSLRSGLVRALESPESAALGRQAQLDVRNLTWLKRAAEILRFVKAGGHPLHE
ncbi:MAG TPA: glycosyltransferase [Candidatus Nitrosotalea sp.]|nr:glycosyltransferase [Candidatus Nitrosotalea sp.]